ncbi:DUF6783 domain-containing protein [Murimonas intestini]
MISPTNCDAHLTESIFQTHSNEKNIEVSSCGIRITAGFFSL